MRYIVQKQLLIYALLVVLTAGVLAHTFFPRYDWRTVENNGVVSIVIYDRWATTSSD